MYATQFVKLTEDQKSFIKKKLCQASLLIKKWVGFYKKSERVSFRWSILRNKPNICNIPVDRLVEFENDVKTILSIKNANHSELNNRNIELSIIEGYCPILYKWSNRNEDMFNDLILQCIFSLYYFTDESKSLISFIRKSSLRMKIRILNRDRLISIPDDHYVQKKAIERLQLYNPNLSIADICKKLNITKRKVKLLNENKVIDNVVESLFDKNGLRHDVACNIESSEVRKITLDDISKAPLSEFQRKVVIASIDGTHGWKSKFASSTINAATNKPYTKMAVSLAYESAIKILQKQFTAE